MNTCANVLSSEGNVPSRCGVVPVEGAGAGTSDTEVGGHIGAGKGGTGREVSTGRQNLGAIAFFTSWWKRDSATSAHKPPPCHASSVEGRPPILHAAGLTSGSSLPGQTLSSESVSHVAHDGNSYTAAVNQSMKSLPERLSPSEGDGEDVSAITSRHIPLKVWMGTASVLVALVLIAAIATIFGVSATSSAARSGQAPASQDPPVTGTVTLAPAPTGLALATDVPSESKVPNSTKPNGRPPTPTAQPSLRPTMRPSALPTQGALPLWGECNPLLIYTYDDEVSCASGGTPSAVGQLYADASCRVRQVLSSQSYAATDLLPGFYSAECVAGLGQYGQVRIAHSGCTNSDCSSSFDSISTCDQDKSSVNSYYSRIDPPVYAVQALTSIQNSSFTCFVLGSDSASVVFAIFGDCSGGNVTKGTGCP